MRSEVVNLDQIRFATYIDCYTGIAHHVEVFLTLPIPLHWKSENSTETVVC